MSNIKAIIFDLDGVLVRTKELHYKALNLALSEVGDEFVITEHEHVGMYDGLTTRQKLSKLSKERGLPLEKQEIVWIKKQLYTDKLLQDSVKRNEELVGLFSYLKESGYKIGLATNSIRTTTELVLGKLGIIDFFDTVVCNTDVTFPKPHPEIYMWSMLRMGVKPEETLILEDSVHGVEAAVSSGAELLIIRNLEETNLENIQRSILKIKYKELSVTRDCGRMNVVIPMAGLGSRFVKEGYTLPKPLIEVINDKPMIQVVLESLGIRANYIYLVNKEHYEKYSLKYLLNLLTPNCKIIQVEGVTEGAACTTLLAKKLIDSSEELIIINSDQYIEWDNNRFFYIMNNTDTDAAILTFEASDPKWSYAKVEDGFVVEVAEKRPISNLATVGCYYWKYGSDYVKYAEQMIKKDIRVNNEFYVCPVFNEAIQDGKRVKTFNVDTMRGLGTPEDLKFFQKEYETSRLS
jgi:HAD superfamily hydrolase (TIGR01509 family)